MTPFTRRLAVPVLCTGLAVLVLPWGGTAEADDGRAFSGYTSLATATPLRIEIYEPTIPIPHTPEFEIDFAYSKVLADTTSTKGRASFMWPGDPVGEGLKTFVEQLGLPPQLGKSGYPVQVNSAFPAGPATQSQAPLPGGFMKSSSEDGRSSASTGFSADGEVQDPEGEDGSADESSPAELLEQFGLAITGQQPAEDEAEEPAQDSATPGIPSPLAALVDMGGYLSSSKSVNSGDKVTATARSALGEVSLLGGIVTMSGLQSRAVSVSDGEKGTGSGTSSYGVMTIAGKKFRMGPDGFEAPGAPQDIPGLPDAPLKALETLGITITFPEPKHEADGDMVVSTLAAIEIVLDTGPLTKLLNTSKINDILGPILAPITDKFPPDAAPLKSLLGALGNLAPRFVITLASARTSVDTVQGIVIPPLDTGGSTVPGGSQGNPGTGSGGTVPGGAVAPVADPPLAETPEVTAPDLVSSTSGLPELFSISGMLMLGAIAAASFLGTYLRRIGLVVLGTGGTCPDGLDAGLPDLRKVM
jgi:hypothetical protein